MGNRRSFLQGAMGIGASLFAGSQLYATQRDSNAVSKKNRSTRATTAFNVPVVTTDIADLPFVMDNGVKVFHLIAEPVKQSILPNKTLDLWGYNGSSPGPTIQVNQGDRVRIIVDNHLPESTAMHWHGFEIPIDMDGMPGISQDPIKPGGRFVYEFDIHQAGTFFYHSHLAMQEMAGMLGGFIMHPSEPYAPHVDHDFLIHLQEYAVLPSSTVPNTMNMEYNWLLLNGKAGPAPTPLLVRQNSRVRIRFVNLGMDHHPMHLHGHTFYVTGTEGGRIPEAGWWPGNTVLVGVAQARAIEFVANNPGTWMLHCHLPHHMMNQMSSNVGRMSRLNPGPGQPAGIGMNEGMGMLQGSPTVPMGDDYGTSLGRGMGFGSESDIATVNGPISQQKATEAMQGDHSMMQMSGAMNPQDIAPNANSVPNFPQDAYMEGPMMAMDNMVEKPENYGLNPGWSGFMQGMMTFVRVLPPDKYDDIMARVRKGEKPSMENMPGMQNMPGMKM
jgi:manganese oxidase